MGFVLGDRSNYNKGGFMAIPILEVVPGLIVTFLAGFVAGTGIAYVVLSWESKPRAYVNKNPDPSYKRPPPPPPPPTDSGIRLSSF